MNTQSWLLAPLVALTLAACGGGDKAAPAAAASSAAAPTAAHDPNVVRVAVGPVYPPYVQSLPAGGFEGYDIDVLKAAGEKAGFTVTFAPYPWTGLLDRLNTNEVDVVAGGMSVSEERQAKFDFSESYDEESIVLVVPKDSPIKSINDIRGKRVAYQTDTNEAAELQKLQGTELDKELGTTSAWLSFKRVIETDATQRADAAIGASSAMGYYASRYKDQGVTIILAPNLPKRPTAFVVKKGNTELLAKLNKGLAAIKADGTLANLHKKWIPEASHHNHTDTETTKH